MKKVVIAAILGAALTALATGSLAVAKGDDGDNRKNHFRTSLDGWQEVASQVTTGRGHFRARLLNADTIEFWLGYSGLEGAVQQAHIHIGSHHENGGIGAWLCKTAGFSIPPDGALPEETCPQSGELHGFIERRDVTGPLGQGVETGNMDDLIRAMRHDEVYVNVHTSRAPAGEIRGDFGHDRRH